MDAMTSLLVALARLGVSLWTENGRLAYSLDPGARIGHIAEKIRRNSSALTEAFGQRNAPNHFVYPLAVRRAANLNVICLHPITGAVLEYRHFARSAPEHCAVYGVQALHWLLQKSPPKSVEDMADAYSAHLVNSSIAGERPFVLYGLSSGGLIAIETARRMIRAGAPLVSLVLGDTRDMGYRMTPTFRLFLDRFFWLRFIEAFLPRRLIDVRRPQHAFWTLSDQERVYHLVDRVSRMREPMLIAGADAQNIAELLESYRQYFYVYRNYRLTPYSGRSLYISASDVSPHLSRSTRASFVGDFALRSIQGGHGTLLTRSGARLIWKILLDEASLASGDGATAT